jgi:hypothetical protein
MDAVLAADSKPPLLRSGIQPGIAVGEDDYQSAIELELISILAGPSFRASSRSAAFLRFVVEERLAGRQDLLKERTIGAAVLGKSPNYDTGADSGVRVRANEVRKRLAAHYSGATARAGIRIELPAGAYVPSFIPDAVWKPRDLAAPARTGPAPMKLWQLAAPSLVAVFLALIAIRGDVESSDSFSRFWNRALAGRSAVTIALDGDPEGNISPSLAEAALPLESLAVVFQVPVHIVAAGAAASGSCVIRMSMRERPEEREWLRVNGASIYRRREDSALWLWADSVEKLRAAAQTLSSRSEFPGVE